MQDQAKTNGKNPPRTTTIGKIIKEGKPRFIDIDENFSGFLGKLILTKEDFSAIQRYGFVINSFKKSVYFVMNEKYGLCLYWAEEFKEAEKNLDSLEKAGRIKDKIFFCKDQITENNCYYLALRTAKDFLNLKTKTEVLRIFGED